MQIRTLHKMLYDVAVLQNEMQPNKEYKPDKSEITNER